MTDPKTAAASPDEARALLLDAALNHIVFDGFSQACLHQAARDVGLSEELADMVMPRGGLDLALAMHEAGDRAMVAALKGSDLGALRFRDRIALAVKLRLQTADKEVVRRASTLFALPQNSAEGARALWRTVDLIWTTLGDTSEDLNWYTKRMTLSGVYSSTVLFWLGDTSEDNADTWAFLDRRIGDVMAFEGMKAKARDNPLTAPAMKMQDMLFGLVKAPGKRADHATPV